jgi:hypothetical protein
MESLTRRVSAGHRGLAGQAGQAGVNRNFKLDAPPAHSLLSLFFFFLVNRREKQ